MSINADVVLHVTPSLFETPSQRFFAGHTVYTCIDKATPDLRLDASSLEIFRFRARKDIAWINANDICRSIYMPMKC